MNSIVKNSFITVTLGISLLVMTNFQSFGQCTLAVSITRPASGTLHANVSGGTAPYTYQWVNSSGNIPGATGADISGLTPCQYLVKVLDSAGCSNLAAHAIMPTNLSGTVTGSINGVAINANVTARLNPALGQAKLDFSPIPPSIGYGLQQNLCLGVLNAFAVGLEHDGALNGGHLMKGNFEFSTPWYYESGESNHTVYVANYTCGDTIFVTGTVSGTVPTLTNCTVNFPLWSDLITSPSTAGGEDIIWNEMTLTSEVHPFEGGALAVFRRKHKHYHVDRCPHFLVVGGNTVTNTTFFPGLPFPERRYGSDSKATYDAATMTLHFELVNNVYPAFAAPTITRIALEGGQVVIDWTGSALESSDDLTNWTDEIDAAYHFSVTPSRAHTFYRSRN